jgi:hypothetical protein
MDSHRINQVSVVSTTGRQTPNTEFGAVLEQTVSQAVKAGTGILGGALGNPVVSAAVTAVSGALGLTQAGANKPMGLATSSSAVIGVGGTLGSAAVGTVGGSSSLGVPTASGSSSSGNNSLSSLLSGSNGDSWALMAAQQSMQSDSQSWQMQYLQLQDQMNKESQQFTAVSNIMKVRNDAAKNAINNIH